MKTFMAGLGIGVVAGLLVAKRGELIRADLKQKAKRFVDSLSDVLTKRGDSGKSLTSRKKPSESLSNAGSPDHEEAAVEVLNTATRDALIAVHGIGQALANRIIENRPYQTAYEVVEKGILAESTFIQLRRELLDKSA
jgi:DNA uptake protein ComE-like DNA-binding protein